MRQERREENLPEQFEAGKHGQEVFLVRKIVATGHPIPADEQDTPAGKGSPGAACFTEKLAGVGTIANRLNCARKAFESMVTFSTPSPLNGDE